MVAMVKVAIQTNMAMMAMLAMIDGNVKIGFQRNQTLGPH